MIRPWEATHRSQCPHAPGEPGWKEWNQLFVQHHRDPGLVQEQHKRMDAVKRSVQAQRTDKNDWHDSVMREVESYNDWIERGQPGEWRLRGIRFTPLDDHDKPILSGRLSFRDPSVQIVPRTGLGAISYFPQIPTDEPVDPQLQLMANLLHTTPDQIKASVDAFANMFVDLGKAVAKVFADIWEALKEAIEVKKEKRYGSGWIPEDWVIWDEEPGHEWVWDMRPHIASITWLQYDSI